MRHFCASAYVVNPENKKILLVLHKKFQKWVQPGGHLEDNELPEEAALRECYEETGVRVKLLGERFPREDDFIRPLGIQKNRNQAGEIHIDIIYAAVPLSNKDVTIDPNESYAAKWFSREELERIDVFPDIKITMDRILRDYIK